MKVKKSKIIKVLYGFAIIGLLGGCLLNSFWYSVIIPNWQIRVLILLVSALIFGTLQIIHSNNKLPVSAIIMLTCIIGINIIGYLRVPYNIEFTFHYVLILMLLIFAMRDQRWIIPFWRILLIVAFIFIITTIWLSFDINSYYTFFSNNIYPNETRFRVWRQQGYTAGITDHYSTNGCALATAVIVIGSMTINSFSEKHKKKKGVYAVFLVVCYWALFLTGKRAHLLFSSIGLLCSLYFSKSRERYRFLKFVGYFIIFAISLVIMSVFIPQVSSVFERFQNLSSDSNMNYRYIFWNQAIEAFKKNPLFGIGWSGFREKVNTINEGHCHNIYIQLLCETGIVGTCILGIWFAYSLKKSMMYVKKANSYTVNFEHKNLSFFCLAYQVYFLLYGLTGNPLYDVYVYPIYYIVCVISIYYSNVIENAKNEVIFN